jgi:hypothetical protein
LLSEVVLQSADFAASLYAAYRRQDSPSRSKNTKNLTIGGALTETLYFAHHAAAIYRAGDISERFARFALQREDCPVGEAPEVRRNFDVAIVGRSAVKKAVQVKLGSGHKYAPRIDVWYARSGFLDETPRIVDALRTVAIAGDESEVMLAGVWLDKWFANRPDVREEQRAAAETVRNGRARNYTRTRTT